MYHISSEATRRLCDSKSSVGRKQTPVLWFTAMNSHLQQQSHDSGLHLLEEEVMD